MSSSPSTSTSPTTTRTTTTIMLPCTLILNPFNNTNNITYSTPFIIYTFPTSYIRQNKGGELLKVIERVRELVTTGQQQQQQLAICDCDGCLLPRIRDDVGNKYHIIIARTTPAQYHELITLQQEQNIRRVLIISQNEDTLTTLYSLLKYGNSVLGYCMKMNLSPSSSKALQMLGEKARKSSSRLLTGMSCCSSSLFKQCMSMGNSKSPLVNTKLDPCTIRRIQSAFRMVHLTRLNQLINAPSLTGTTATTTNVNINPSPPHVILRGILLTHTPSVLSTQFMSSTSPPNRFSPVPQPHFTLNIAYDGQYSSLVGGGNNNHQRRINGNLTSNSSSINNDNTGNNIFNPNSITYSSPNCRLNASTFDDGTGRGCIVRFFHSQGVLFSFTFNALDFMNEFDIATTPTTSPPPRLVMSCYTVAAHFNRGGGLNGQRNVLLHPQTRVFILCSLEKDDGEYNGGGTPPDVIATGLSSNSVNDTLPLYFSCPECFTQTPCPKDNRICDIFKCPSCNFSVPTEFIKPLLLSSIITTTATTTHDDDNQQLPVTADLNDNNPQQQQQQTLNTTNTSSTSNTTTLPLSVPVTFSQLQPAPARIPTVIQIEEIVHSRMDGFSILFPTLPRSYLHRRLYQLVEQYFMNDQLDTHIQELVDELTFEVMSNIPIEGSTVAVRLGERACQVGIFERVVHTHLASSDDDDEVITSCRVKLPWGVVYCSNQALIVIPDEPSLLLLPQEDDQTGDEEDGDNEQQHVLASLLLQPTHGGQSSSSAVAARRDQQEMELFEDWNGNNVTTTTATSTSTTTTVPGSLLINRRTNNNTTNRRFSALLSNNGIGNTNTGRFTSSRFGYGQNSTTIALSALPVHKYKSPTISTSLEVKKPINNTTNNNNDDENKRLCQICQYDFVNGEDVRYLPCMHQFHVACVDEWLSRHDMECPVCRTKAYEGLNEGDW
jgi:hypothetical protein